MKNLVLVIVALLSFNAIAYGADFKQTLQKDEYGRSLYIPPMQAKFDKVEWWGDTDDGERAQGDGKVEWTKYKPNGEIAYQYAAKGTMKDGFWVGDRVEFIDGIMPSNNLTFWLYKGKAIIAQKGTYPNFGNEYYSIGSSTFWSFESKIDFQTFMSIANKYYKGKFPKRSAFQGGANSTPAAPAKPAAAVSEEKLSEVEVQQNEILPLSTDKNGVIVGIPPMGIDGATVVWTGPVDSKNRATGSGDLRYYKGSTLDSALRGTMKKGRFTGDRFESIDYGNPKRNATFWLDIVGPILAQKGIYPNLQERYWTINTKTYWELEIETNDESFVMVAKNFYKNGWPKNSDFARIEKKYKDQKAAEERADYGPNGIYVPHKGWPGYQCSDSYTYHLEHDEPEMDYISHSLMVENGYHIKPFYFEIRKKGISFTLKDFTQMRFMTVSDWLFVRDWAGDSRDMSTLRQKDHNKFIWSMKEFKAAVDCYMEVARANPATNDHGKAYYESDDSRWANRDAIKARTQAEREEREAREAQARADSEAADAARAARAEENRKPKKDSSKGSGSGKAEKEKKVEEKPKALPEEKPKSKKPPEPQSTDARLIGANCVSFVQHGSGISSDYFKVVNGCGYPVQVIFCEETNITGKKCVPSNVPAWGTTSTIEAYGYTVTVLTEEKNPDLRIKAYVCDMRDKSKFMCLLPKDGKNPFRIVPEMKKAAQ
ncbi:hypothetical protein [Bdellovibrio sp. HCB288]|uniref:hypothetical protein n=1 Tax=Bdellovibrio sp. HCB288 TaxID=3394355 RepID=UPI0039B4F747